MSDSSKANQIKPLKTNNSELKQQLEEARNDIKMLAQRNFWNEKAATNFSSNCPTIWINLFNLAIYLMVSFCTFFFSFTFYLLCFSYYAVPTHRLPWLALLFAGGVIIVTFGLTLIKIVVLVVVVLPQCSTRVFNPLATRNVDLIHNLMVQAFRFNNTRL